jgi:hypothetical protein
MAFFRFNRDRRGYEHFYLVEPVTNRRGKTRPRVLYWYRSPPNVRVGRAPFDEEVQRALEAQNPGVAFDWKKIVDAPIPSADVEKWRERRRVEKAEKARLRSAAVPVVDETVDEAAEEAVGPDDSELPAEDSQPVAVADVSTSAPAIRKRRRRRRGRGREEPMATSASMPAGDSSQPGDGAATPAEAPPEPSGD